MASKRRLRRRQCEGKKRYTSRAEAVTAAINYQRKFGARKNAYNCKFCKGWHFGTQPWKMRGSPERLASFRNGR